MERCSIPDQVRRHPTAYLPYRIFVSHSHEDNAWCRTFVQALHKAGFDVWFDEQSMGFGTLRKTIERELIAWQVFIVVLSPAAIASNWVAAEMDAAQDLERDQSPDEPERILIPVIAEACKVPLFWRRYKRVCGPGNTGLSAHEAAAQVIGIVSPPDGRGEFPGAQVFLASIGSAPERYRVALRQVCDWAISLEHAKLARLRTKRGKTGILSLLPWPLAYDGGLVTIWSDNGAYVSFWRGVFERLAPVSLPHIEQLLAPMTIGQGNWTHNITEELLAALTLAYREAATATARGDDGRPAS